MINFQTRFRRYIRWNIRNGRLSMFKKLKFQTCVLLGMLCIMSYDILKRSNSTPCPRELPREVECPHVDIKNTQPPLVDEPEIQQPHLGQPGMQLPQLHHEERLLLGDDEYDIQRAHVESQNEEVDENSRQKETIQETNEPHNRNMMMRTISSKLIRQCPNMERPNPDTLPKYKGYYHQFSAAKNSTTHAYFLNTYLDNRYGQHEDTTIRTVGTANFDLTKFPMYAAFWYPGLDVPAVVQCEVFLGPAPLGKNAVMYGFVRYTLLCLIPITDFDMPPEYVSLSVDKCKKPMNYIQVVQPLPKDPNDPYKIGNCMQSLYGNFTEKFALMFVNWLETITMYGISEVTVNLNNFTNNEFGEKIFQYYTKKGILKVTTYPDVIPPDTTVKEQLVGRIQSFIQLPFIDCFFKNMHRYWYFAPLDTDEVFYMKKGYKTYQEYLMKYLDKHPISRNSVFISAQTAGYYLQYNEENATSRVPEYMPMFQYTKRDELIQDVFSDHRKSFQNPRTCLFASFHGCKPISQSLQMCPECGYRPIVLPSEDIVLNHYRDKCKGNHGCLTKDKAIYEPGLARGRIGRNITQRVTATLTELGYFDNRKL